MLKNGSRTRRLWNSFYSVCVRLDSRILRSLNNTQAPDKRGKPRPRLYAWNLDPIFWITGGKSPLHNLPNRAGHMEGRKQLENNSGSVKSIGRSWLTRNRPSEISLTLLEVRIWEAALLDCERIAADHSEKRSAPGTRSGAELPLREAVRIRWTISVREGSLSG